MIQTMPRDDDSLAEGIHFFKQGDYGAALAWLQEIPDESPRRVEALLYIGRIYLAGDRPQLAEQCFRTVSQHRPEAYIFFLLGESLLAQEQAVPAEAAFRQALRRDPASASGLVMLGRAVGMQGRLEEAVRALEASIARDSRLAAARFYLADTLVKKGDMLRAAGQLHYLLQLEPKYVPAFVLKGDIAFRMKDYRQAATEYERARAGGAREPAMLERLGHAYLALDDEPRALIAYDAAISADQRAWEAYIWAGRVAQVLRLRRRALRYYTAVADHPEFGAEARDAAWGIQERLAMTEPAGGSNLEDDALEPLPDPGAPPEYQAEPPRPAGPTTRSFSLHERYAPRRAKTTTKLPAPPLEFDDVEPEDEEEDPAAERAVASPVQRGLEVLKAFLKEMTDT